MTGLGWAGLGRDGIWGGCWVEVVDRLGRDPERVNSGKVQREGKWKVGQWNGGDLKGH